MIKVLHCIECGKTEFKQLKNGEHVCLNCGNSFDITKDNKVIWL